MKSNRLCNKLVLVFALSLVLGSGVVAGADYYVSPGNYSPTISVTAAAGDTIYFMPGTYNTPFLVNKPLTLIADTGDYRTSRVRFTGIATGGQSWADIASSNVTISGFVFEDAFTENQHGASSIFRFSAISANIDNVTIEKNKISNTYNEGIRMHSASTRNISNVVIADNYFSEIGHSENRSASPDGESAIWVWCERGATVVCLQNSVIRDNIFDNTTSAAIHIGQTVKDLVISNNTIYRTAKNGIKIYDSPDSNVNITGNTIRWTNNDRTTIKKESVRAILAGANFAGYNASALQTVWTDSGNSSNSLVKFVSPTSNAAVFIDNSSKILIESNVITDNHDGIFVCPTSSCAVFNYSNHLGKPAYYADALIRNNVIHSNTGNDGGYLSGDGRNLINVQDVTIDALGNYWGSVPPDASLIWGDVNYEIQSVVDDVDERSAHDVDEINESPVIIDIGAGSDEDATVQSINLSANETVNNVTVVVAVADSKPDLVGRNVPSSKRVYAYVEIENNINESDFQINATITFTVSRSWLDSNRIDRDTVELLRFSNGRWMTLETSFVSQTGDVVTFSAVTPGFSVFAITGVRSSSSSGGSGGGSSGSGGSGSGSSTYIPAASTFPWLFVDRQAVNVVSSLSPDSPFVFNTSGRNVVITSVTVKVNTGVRNAALVAASLRSRPSSISAAPEGTVYRYVGVGTDNVNKAFIDGITTTFAVSKEWMTANNADSGNIALFAYDSASSSWVNKGARMTNETAESVLFEADTRGSEIFAIVSQGEKAEAETPAEPEEPETPAPPAEPVDPEQGEENAEPETTAPEPEPIVLKPDRGVSPLAVTVIVVLAVGIAAFAFAAYYKKKRA